MPDLDKNEFEKAQKTYSIVGPFQHAGLMSTTAPLKEVVNKDWVYMGECKPGTDTPHGIGIKVRKIGQIYEGTWKDGKRHGRTRMIDWDGHL
mmetsp:Transcript_19326/g.22480  ORF Transcript_19326/g.22480 Transcript_19326/m.22480 type:complete len:92 (+) Transcript_19326:83-358(+)